MRVARAVFVFACAGALLAAAPVFAQSKAKTAASGKTQVVAKVGGREVTLIELRLEMAALGLSSANANAERIALESIVNRLILADAARDANFHRRPDALIRMRAAQDQALADLYLGVAAQPPEPTQGEIDDFIRDNASLFATRKRYGFSIIELPTDAFDEDAMTTLFDEEPDFFRLISALEKTGVKYALNTTTQSSAAFPKPIRDQLAKYGVSDNIVLKGESQTQIMKIMTVARDDSDSKDWPVLARRLLLEQASAERANAVLTRLKTSAPIAYYRPTATPSAD